MPVRVLVCGTNYGATYLRALAGAPNDIVLAGILSTGSARSCALAQQWQVTHHTALDEIAIGSIDIACVAVPGEAGHALALALLERGIHVLCEHPIGAQQMRTALALAAKQRCVFQVNAHFADLAAPQAFFQSLAVARQLGPALHYDLALNLRTLYSGLDLLGRALGALDAVQPCAAPPVAEGEPPPLFANLQLDASGTRVSLLCQNFASAVDDGTATLLNHRCSATFAHGNLLLAESNGPVLWFPSPVSLAPQHWRSYLPVDMSQLDAMQLQHQRDMANRSAIIDMMAVIAGRAPLPHQHPAYLHALAALWERVLHLLQPPPQG